MRSVCLALLASLAAGVAFARDPQPVAATADDLLTMARRIDDKAPALANLWPGYWPAGQGYVLYERGVGAVFGGGVAAGGPEFRAGDLENVRFSFVLDYAGGPPNTVLFEVSGPDDDLSTLFHEQFHDFQNDAFHWTRGGGGEFVDLELIPDLAAYTADLAFERSILALALAAEAPDERRRLARAYIALRRERQQGLAEDIVNVEAYRELIEGTADLIGQSAAAVTTDASSDNVRRHIVDSLTTPLVSDAGGYSTGVFRTRAYGVGAAVGWLLDEWAGPGWKSRAAGGEALDALLEGAIGAASSPDLPPLRLEHGYEALSRTIATTLASHPPVVSVDAFLARTRHHLVVTLEYPASQRGSVSFSGAMTPLAQNTIALTKALEFSAASAGAVLQVRNRPVLIEGSRQEQRRSDRITVLLDTLDGQQALPRGRLSAPVRIETEDVTLELPIGAEIEETATDLIIRVSQD